MKKLYFLAALVFVIACTKDRDITTPDDTTTPPSGAVGYLEGAPGVLKINEFMANPPSNAPDWIEIFNPSNDTAKLEAGRWFVTDKAADNFDKAELPELIILPHSFLLIWCDTVFAGQTSVDFGLSSGGEDIGVFYQDDEDNFIEVDRYTFGPHTNEGYSEGRNPDGGPNWEFFPNATPGESNQ